MNATQRRGLVALAASVGARELMRAALGSSDSPLIVFPALCVVIAIANRLMPDGEEHEQRRRKQLEEPLGGGMQMHLSLSPAARKRSTVPLDASARKRRGLRKRSTGKRASQAKSEAQAPPQRPPELPSRAARSTSLAGASDDLEEFLRKLDLAHRHQALRALGAEHLEHLRDLREDDLDGTDLLLLERRRLLRGIANLGKPAGS